MPDLAYAIREDLLQGGSVMGDSTVKGTNVTIIRTKGHGLQQLTAPT